MLSINTPPAFACTPPPTPPDGVYPTYTTADKINVVDVVFEGTVIAVEGDWLETATIEVQRYFKGTGTEIVSIDNFGPSSLCLISIEVGQHFIFYANGNPPNLKGSYYFNPPYGPKFGPLGEASPEKIAEIIAIIGQDPVDPIKANESTNSQPTPSSEESTNTQSTPSSEEPTNSNGGWVWLIGGIAGLLLLGGGIYFNVLRKTFYHSK